MSAFARLRRALHDGVTVQLMLALVVLCGITLGATPAYAKKVHKITRTPVVTTPSGQLQGIINGHIEEYLGIPYAAPPVGNLRWMPPQPYGGWQGVLDASAFGSECTQPGGVGTENCLFLNIYVPKKKSGGKKHRKTPAMFWIHGGGLTAGAGSDYNPTPLVERGVIVVTINYRLGYLGFIAQSALDSEGHEAGNYGLQDQQFAMQWVRDNIAAFGGDSGNVTIFGESAGGHSVYCQLASPTAAGLFEKAISESGSYVIFDSFLDPIVPLSAAETTGSSFVPSGASIADSVGCTDQTAACLRAVSNTELINVEPGTLYALVDGTLLTETPEQAFAAGTFNQVPVIAGTNHDEWRAFVAEEYDFAGNPILTANEYDNATIALWTSLLGPMVETVYPYSAYPSGGIALGTSGTDGVFACGARTADQLLAQFTTTYAYEFNDENAPPPQSDIPGLTFPLGAYHGAEIQYLFDSDFYYLLDAAQQHLAAAMVRYWTAFAATGDPNGASNPKWAPYDPTSDEFQSFIPPTPKVESTFNTDHQCDSFWNQI